MCNDNKMESNLNRDDEGMTDTRRLPRKKFTPFEFQNGRLIFKKIKKAADY